MPIYSFNCESCNLNFEVKLPRDKADQRPQCPDCHSKKQVFRDFLADDISVQEAPKTLGSLADKNTSKFSDEYKKKVNPRKSNDQNQY